MQRNSAEQGGNDRRHLRRGRYEMGEDLGQTDFGSLSRARRRVAASRPVRYEGKTGIVEIQFAREYGFGHAGHADQIAAIAAHACDLRCGLKARSLGGAIAAASYHNNADALCRSQQVVTQLRVVWLSEIHVLDLGAVDVAEARKAAVRIVDD